MLPRSSHWVVATIVLALAFNAAGPATAQVGQEGAVWNLGTQMTGSRHATTVSAVNVSCRGKRDFEIEIEGEARRFLKVTGPTRLEKIAPGQTRTTPAMLDLNGVPAGVYNEGAIIVRCLNCPPKCRQDYTRIAVYLTVTGPPGSTPQETAGGGSTSPGTEGGGTEGGRSTSEGTGSGGSMSPGIATTASSPGSGGSTRARKPCPEDTSACDELKARADAAREAAAAAGRAADEAERNQQYDERDAEWEDEDIERALEYARVLRRQAADWRELAAYSRAEGQVNRDRANQWPPGHEYRADWEREAALDQGWARDRDARADELEKEAEKLEEPLTRRRREAEEQRTKAARLRAQAEAMERTAEDAQAAYEACLNRLRVECERRERQAQLAELARTLAASRARDAASRRANEPSVDPDQVDPGRAFLPGYESVVPRLSPFCKWATYEIPREALATNIRLMAANSRDDTSAIEIRRTSAAGTRIGFQYHCKKTSGTAIIAFTLSSGDNPKKYKLRIGCIAE